MVVPNATVPKIVFVPLRIIVPDTVNEPLTIRGPTVPPDFGSAFPATPEIVET